MRHAAKRQTTRFSPVWRTAVSVFFLSLFIFSLILFVPWLSAHSAREQPIDALGEHGRQRSLLLLIHDNGTLTGAVAVQTDTATLSVRVTGYPQQTEVVCGTSLCTLAACYDVEGAAAADYLSIATGERYDAALRLSAEAMGTLVSRLGGGIVYTLPEAVGLLPAGEQTLTARQIDELLCYDGWTSATGQAASHAGIVAAIIDRYLSPRQELTDAFNALTAVCDDRLTVAQLAVLRSELQALAAANTNGLCIVNVPNGRTVGTEGARRYVLTE